MANDELNFRLSDLEKRYDNIVEWVSAIENSQILALQSMAMAIGLVDEARGRQDFRVSLEAIITDVEKIIENRTPSVTRERQLREGLPLLKTLYRSIPHWEGPPPGWPADLPQTFQLLASPEDRDVSPDEETRHLGNLTEQQWDSLAQIRADSNRAGSFVWAGKELVFRSSKGTAPFDGSKVWREVAIVVRRVPEKKEASE
jgi:hypothetical protein